MFCKKSANEDNKKEDLLNVKVYRGSISAQSKKYFNYLIEIFGAQLNFVFSFLHERTLRSTCKNAPNFTLKLNYFFT